MATTTTECIDLAIIGGGPAGLAAAISAARAGAHPVVIEGRDRLAETIRPTGDGRCNISNSHVTAWDYHNADFVRRAFLSCHPKQVRAFLEGCGIMLREEAQGRLYPQPNKSTAVIEALLAAARRADVESRTGKRVRFLRRNADVWTISFEDGSRLRARSVIVCTGGGLAGEFVPHAVSVEPARPVLAPLACNERAVRGLDKIRVKCALTWEDVVEEGEITFRSYGISGICAFNISRFVEPGQTVHVDFAPALDRSNGSVFLRQRLDSLEPRTWREFTTGMLLPPVAAAVLRAAAIQEGSRPRRGDLAAFEEAWRAFPLAVKGIGDARLAQVRRGGIAVSCIDPRTMAVKDAPGLHAAGEAVDVDGPCGGYNLHWAWASGIIAGHAVAQGASSSPSKRASCSSRAHLSAPKHVRITEGLACEKGVPEEDGSRSPHGGEEASSAQDDEVGA